MQELDLKLQTYFCPKLKVACSDGSENRSKCILNINGFSFLELIQEKEGFTLDNFFIKNVMICTLSLSLTFFNHLIYVI